MQARAIGWTKASDRLGPWNYYFAAKVALFTLGLIDLHLAANLVFAAAIFAMASPRTRAARPWIGVPVAIALLYYDSRLPGISRAISQAGLISSFSSSYLVELAGRFFGWKAIAIVGLAIAACAAASRIVRIDALVLAAMAAMALWWTPARPLVEDAGAHAPEAKAGSTARDPDAMVAEFFSGEAQRRVAFGQPEGVPFDVIFLHVCSLSWDDLQATGLDKHPLFSGFDILLRRFNAVSTYSGPAVIRLLRAPCGQPRHAALYTAAAPECLLMPDLLAAGLEPQLALNHDGHFDGFLGHVRSQGMLAAPVSLKGIAAPLRGFDDSRIYDDASVLARWIRARAQSPAPRTVLYYNTLTLHDGNHFASDPFTKSSATYKVRLAKLLSDLQDFVNEVAASGRRSVIVLIPEHGAAFRGDNAQIPGLRDTPTPAITLVPVGIRVVGPGARRVGDPVAASEETSFLALSHIVAAMLAQPPFGADGFHASDYTVGMPGTPFVSEGENDIVVRRDGAYLIRHEREAWKELR
jgi:cellulose synthase operon protein YhjU